LIEMLFDQVFDRPFDASLHADLEAITALHNVDLFPFGKGFANVESFSIGGCVPDRAWRQPTVCIDGDHAVVYNIKAYERLLARSV